MGMTGGYLRVQADQLQDLIASPDLLQELLMPEIMGGGNGLDVYKSWHGIHYVLTGSSWEGKPPLKNVVLGGTEIGEDVGYGPARYLTPAEVREVAEALKPIDDAEFARRFNADEMAEDEIYAFDPDAAEDELDGLLDTYRELRQYYLDAASNKDGMLLYMV